MTITSQSNRISYDGNGSTQNFAFPYSYLAKSDVVVMVVSSLGVETIKTMTTHYTLTDPSPSGGTVSMLVAPASGEQLVIYRDVPLTQEFNPEEGGALPADTLEDALDKLTMIAQQLNDLISRSLVLSPATEFSDLRLPDPAGGELLGWNGAADELVNVLPGDVSLFTLTALARTLCSQSTEAAMAGVLGGSVPAIQALAAPAAADAYNAIRVNSAGSGVELFYPHRRNLIINPAFDIWQRGATFTSAASGQYGADRFAVAKAGAMVFDYLRSTTVPTVAQAGRKVNYSICLDVTTADASMAATDYTLIRTRIEGYDAAAIIGKKVTLSFWVRATKAGIYCVAFGNSGSDRSYVAEYTISAANTWEFKTVTLTMHDASAGTWDFTTGNGLQVSWCLCAGSNFQTTAGAWQSGNYIATANQVNAMDNTANFFFLAGVQLEQGPVATQFEFRLFSQELALCQRYYEKSFTYSIAPAQNAGDGGGSYMQSQNVPASSGMYGDQIRWRAMKRASPTVTLFNPSAANAHARCNTGTDCSGTTVATVDDQGFSVYCVTPAGSGLGYYWRVHWTADAEL